MIMTMAVASETDTELLQRFAEQRSEEAFAVLVGRHLDLVHSAARRQCRGDENEAQDVTQAVFTELARQASRLAGHPALVGWLFATTHRIASRRQRDARRRQRRETEAHFMQTVLSGVGSEPEADWERIAPVLDAAMHGLSEADRLALLLRFFERRPLAEVGAKLGIRENAARMRVERALEKLRLRLERHGVTSSAAAMSMALSGSGVGAASPALAASVVSSALTGSAVTLIPIGIWTLMVSAKLKVISAVVAAALLGIPWAYEYHRRVDLARENARIAGQLEQTRRDLKQAQADAGRLAAVREESRLLREEVLRLRGEHARLKSGMERRSIPLERAEPSREPAKTGGRPFQAQVQASIPAGSSLLTGGWPSAPGKRALVLVSPSVDTSNPGALQVSVQPILFEGSEDQLEALGLNMDINGASDDAPKTFLTEAEAKELMERLKETEGVDMLSAPGISTLSGRQAQLAIGGEGSGGRIAFDLVPTVTETMGVNLSLHIDVQPGPDSALERSP
jgi:RNA polymerase sigma factor (sigma-70 family)